MRYSSEKIREMEASISKTIIVLFIGKLVENRKREWEIEFWKVITNTQNFGQCLHGHNLFILQKFKHI